MNGYIALYRGKRKEVYAKDMYAAQLHAAALFNAKHSYNVSVYLAELDGKQVTTTITD